MSSPGFLEYIQEYQSVGIGNLLYSLLLRVVANVIKRYPEHIYSPNGIWDEDAISSLCHDFTLEKILRTGLLEHYLVALETVDQLQRSLERDFRHYLINQRKRTEFQNFVQRIQKMLMDKSSFKKCSASSHGSWGLSEWETRLEVQRLDEVVEAMYKVPLPPAIRYKSSSTKVSHIISNEDLQKLLENTFYELNRCVRFDLLIESVRYRLNLLDIDFVSLDEPISLTSSDSATYADIVAAAEIEPNIETVEVASSIFEKLSARQRRILSVYLTLEKPTLEQISSQVGVSKGTVRSDLSIIETYIASADLNSNDAEKAFMQLSELCAEDSE